MFDKAFIIGIASILVLTLNFVDVKQAETESTVQQTLKGTVTDLITEETLVGVKVTLEGTDRSATSNEEGQYSIANLEPGSYTIYVNHDGYEKYSKVVEVKQEDVTQSIKLQPMQ